MLYVKKIVSVSSHITIVDKNGLVNWKHLAETIHSSNHHVKHIDPYIDTQGLLYYSNNVAGVAIKAINSSTNINAVKKHIVSGSYHSLLPGSYNALIGVGIANTLGINVGDKLTLTVPIGKITPIGFLPTFKMFTVSGIFKTGLYDYDANFMIVNLHDAQTMLQLGNKITGLMLHVDDFMNTPLIKYQLMNTISTKYSITDWIDLHKNYFSAVQLEKHMMWLVLIIIIIIAAFNLVVTLVMVVNTHAVDIAILRTMGASKSQILRIFIYQGLIAGIFGSVVGTTIGIITAYYIGNIVAFFERLLHIKLIQSGVYLIDYLPSKILFSDVSSIFCITFIFSCLATIYPSLQAAKTHPVNILRTH